MVFDLEGLAPRTFYRYALHGADEGSGKGRILLGQDRPHRLRTPPGGDEPYSFAFYSCHMPYRVRLFDKTDIVNMQMWDRLLETLGRHRDQDLAFVIAGGDQVYTDGVDTLNIWKFLNKVMRREGYRFERLALYTDSNFSLVKVDPERDRVIFQLYGEQKVEAPDTVKVEKVGTSELAVSHAIAKIQLRF